jgi:hypothetical protein
MKLDPRDPSNLPITFGRLVERKGARSPRGCGGAALFILVLPAFLLALLRMIS